MPTPWDDVPFPETAVAARHNNTLGIRTMERKGLWSWVILKLVIAAAIFESLVVGFETINAIQCHYSSKECWPWFFATLINYPFSVQIFQFVRFVYDQFQITSFVIQTTIMAVSFFVFGSLWWSALLHIPVFVVRLGRRWFARVPQ